MYARLPQLPLDSCIAHGNTRNSWQAWLHSYSNPCSLRLSDFILSAQPDKRYKTEVNSRDQYTTRKKSVPHGVRASTYPEHKSERLSIRCAIDAKDKPISWPRKLWNTALPPVHAALSRASSVKFGPLSHFSYGRWKFHIRWLQGGWEVSGHWEMVITSIQWYLG